MIGPDLFLLVVLVPVAPTTHYEETQRFRQRWLWALLLISAFPAGLVGIVSIVTDTDARTNIFLWIGILVVPIAGPLVLIYAANLRINAHDYPCRCVCGRSTSGHGRYHTRPSHRSPWLMFHRYRTSADSAFWFRTRRWPI